MVKMQERYYPRKSASTFIARAEQTSPVFGLPSRLMLLALKGQLRLELECAR
jgi:hypothetical protein